MDVDNGGVDQNAVFDDERPVMLVMMEVDNGGVDQNAVFDDEKPVM